MEKVKSFFEDTKAQKRFCRRLKKVFDEFLITVKEFSEAMDKLMEIKKKGEK